MAQASPSGGNAWNVTEDMRRHRAGWTWHHTFVTRGDERYREFTRIPALFTPNQILRREEGK